MSLECFPLYVCDPVAVPTPGGSRLAWHDPHNQQASEKTDFFFSPVVPVEVLELGLVPNLSQPLWSARGRIEYAD